MIEIEKVIEKVEESKTMPLICLRCRKPIPLTYPTFSEVSYTHYSYCEDCLRAGLFLLRQHDAQKVKVNQDGDTVVGVDLVKLRDAMIALYDKLDGEDKRAERLGVSMCVDTVLKVMRGEGE